MALVTVNDTAHWYAIIKGAVERAGKELSPKDMLDLAVRAHQAARDADDMRAGLRIAEECLA